MILTLKNKMLAAFDKMIEDAKRYGGEPKQIVLSPEEAVALMREIRKNPTLRDDIRVWKKSIPLIALKIWRADKATVLEVNDVVRKWYTKFYTFKFKGIDIVIAKPVNTETAETKRTPIKPFNCWGDIPNNQNYD